MAQPIDQVRTRRLLLARMRESDHADLCRMHRDPEVMATLGGCRSDEWTTEFLERMLAHWREHAFGWWVLRELASGRFVGRGGLRHVTVDAREEVEVGYGLLRQFWGRGFATELAVESVRIGFETLGRTELVSFTLPANRASRRVMEKAGFRYERDFIHAGLPHVLYRLTAAAWSPAADVGDDEPGGGRGEG